MLNLSTKVPMHLRGILITCKSMHQIDPCSSGAMAPLQTSPLAISAVSLPARGIMLSVSKMVPPSVFTSMAVLVTRGLVVPQGHWGLPIQLLISERHGLAEIV